MSKKYADKTEEFIELHAAERMNRKKPKVVVDMYQETECMNAKPEESDDEL
jgi:hypothetical protein